METIPYSTWAAKFTSLIKARSLKNRNGKLLSVNVLDGIDKDLSVRKEQSTWVSWTRNRILMLDSMLRESMPMLTSSLDLLNVKILLVDTVFLTSTTGRASMNTLFQK